MLITSVDSVIQMFYNSTEDRMIKFEDYISPDSNWERKTVLKLMWLFNNGEVRLALNMHIIKSPSDVIDILVRHAKYLYELIDPKRLYYYHLTRYRRKYTYLSFMHMWKKRRIEISGIIIESHLSGEPWKEYVFEKLLKCKKVCICSCNMNLRSNKIRFYYHSRYALYESNFDKTIVEYKMYKELCEILFKAKVLLGRD